MLFVGHGTFLRGLETTATYDKASQEFIIHSPTVTSLKWWPGSVARLARPPVPRAPAANPGVCPHLMSAVAWARPPTL